MHGQDFYTNVVKAAGGRFTYSLVTSVSGIDEAETYKTYRHSMPKNRQRRSHRLRIRMGRAYFLAGRVEQLCPNLGRGQKQYRTIVGKRKKRCQAEVISLAL